MIANELTLTTYTGISLRGTGGLVALRSADGYIGLYRPTTDVLSPFALAILHWALHHPKTRTFSGWLRLDDRTFAYLNGDGTATHFARVPESL